MMAKEDEGLWPRISDAASDGIDEQREVDEALAPLDEEDPDFDEVKVDADDRPVTALTDPDD